MKYKPIHTSILLAVYSLGILGLSIWAVLTNGSSACSQLSFIVPMLLWVVTVPVVFVVGLIVVWRYGKKIKNLKNSGQKVPAQYVASLLLLPVAILSIFWVAPIASVVDKWSADSKMNTIDEFRSLVRDCKVGSVAFYHNDYHHKANDADAYMVVYSTDYDEMFYSYNQKDELQEIVYGTYLGNCPLQTSYSSGTIGGLTQYSDSDWSKGIQAYSAPGGC